MSKHLDPQRPTVPEVLPFVKALYATRDGACGCCLHVVLDDYNCETGCVEHCLSYAKERGHVNCIALAELLLKMSYTQRLKVARQKVASCFF